MTPNLALPTVLQPERIVVRRRETLGTMESALARAGFVHIAGADEAGRGACAGPLVAAACILPTGRRGNIPGLNDSKLLTEKVREQLYTKIVDRAIAWHVVQISAPEVDRIRLHVANIQALRRAITALTPSPAYILTDGFPVDGLPGPALAVWKGDQVASCIAAASILAKVTRDRVMIQLHDQYPAYGFAVHKGYSTQEHQAALAVHGPCAEHRMTYANVRRVSDFGGLGNERLAAEGGHRP